jgi:hypothetical protein
VGSLEVSCDAVPEEVGADVLRVAERLRDARLNPNHEVLARLYDLRYNIPIITRRSLHIGS